ncbi:MAG: patatin-like phospholipase family protein [Thermoanaerobaculia bacterium]|nr:patatin-like phospholipase family protein [Thermoanaerobaculia bacterium]
MASRETEIDPVVVESLRRRADERRAGLPPSEGRTALVVQGGGLRSIASCATLAALNRLGLTEAFDCVYAVSSGAVNAAYFVTEQAALGVTVYLEDVTDHRFFNLWRPRKMMDLEFFFDDVVLDLKRHDTEKMVGAATEVRVITTHERTGEPRWFSSREHPEVDFYAALKASCSLPVVYPTEVEVDGASYVDGGYWEPLPLLTPVREALYSDILVAMTRHTGDWYLEGPRLKDHLVTWPLLRLDLSKPVFEAYKSRGRRYNEALRIVRRGQDVQGEHQTRVAAVAPDESAQVGRFEKRPERLADSAYCCWRKTFELFGVEEGSDRQSFDEIVERSKQRRPEGERP